MMRKKIVNFKCLYLDPSIEAPFDIFKNGLHDSDKKASWFNHLVESDAEITMLNDSDVLVRVLGVTFCNTDISEIISRGSRAGQVGRRQGKIFLGHEVVGEIVEKGKDVTGIRDGDRVCIGDFNTCRSFNILPECENCSNGRGVICTQKHLRKFNANSYGGFSEYMVRSQYQVVKIDRTIDNATACLIEPAAIAHHCYRLIRRNNVQNVLIFGCGTIGIILLRILKFHLGDTVTVDCISENDNHQKQAKLSGSNFVSNNLDSLRRDYFGNFLDNTGASKGGYDVIVDFVGNSLSVNYLSNIVRAGGMFLELAFPKEDLNFNIDTIVRNEIKFIGVHGYQGGKNLGENDFHSVIRLISSGEILVGDLISRRANFSNIRQDLISECIGKINGINNHGGFRVFAG